MLGPMLVFLLLLLLPLPSPLLGSGSTFHPYLTQDQGDDPGSWLQESPATGESCWSTYDVYFVLDSSGSVTSWMIIRNFVKALVNKFKNPKQRMSVITFSTHGHINMELTSDREKINTALVDLLSVLPTGATNMEHGLKKANEQMQRMSDAGEKAPSLIIALTGGELRPESFEQTKVEAEKSKQLGATLYFVGVEDYKKHQLLELAGEEGHVLGVQTGYSRLEDNVDSLIARSCVQITSVDVSAVCTRDKKIKVYGKGFQNAQKDKVICQFRVGNKTIGRRAALSVEDTSITCPGVKINNPGRAVFIDISLNNGRSFIKTDFAISRNTCATYREGTPAALLDAVPPAAPPASQRRAFPDALPEGTPEIDVGEGSSRGVFLTYTILYWAVPLLVLPCILPLCWCAWRWCSKRVPASPAQTSPMVVVSCCRNHEKEHTRALEDKLGPLCDLVETCIEGPQACQPTTMYESAIPLMAPCGEPLSCHTWIHHKPSYHCSHLSSSCPWCQGLQPSCCRLSDDAYPCCSLHAPERRFAMLDP